MNKATLKNKAIFFKTLATTRSLDAHLAKACQWPSITLPKHIPFSSDTSPLFKGLFPMCFSQHYTSMQACYVPSKCSYFISKLVRVL